jgi:dephospho-CoA kinase
MVPVLLLHMNRHLPASGSRILCMAVTGGIACGKSTFANFLREFGIEIFDTDAAAHDLQKPGGVAVDSIANLFGRGVLAAHGGVDRSALGRKVFADPEALARLNALIHPLIRESLDAWRAAPLPAGCVAKAALVPLLFEVGWGTDEWDLVVCVACSPGAQLRRLMGRGLAEDEARRRVAAQWPVEMKTKRSDLVIYNDGDVAELRERAHEAVVALLEKTA